MSEHKIVLLLLGDAEAPHTRRWANWFAAHGCEVHVATFNNNRDSGYEKVNIHTLWLHGHKKNIFLRLIKSMVIMYKLKMLHKKIKPSVVHCHSAGAYSWSANLLNMRPRIVTPWGTDLLVDVKKSKINFWLTRKSLENADLITTDAKHFCEILQNFNKNKNRILFIPFGTDINKFHLKSFSDKSGDIRVISTRTLNPVHSVSTLIEAIPKVVQEIENIKFIVVGGGSEFENLVERCKELQIEKFVTFKGMLDEKTLSETLRSCDIYVSTSPYDAGLAASTAEAMACGLPIIQTNTADNRQWSDEHTGSLFDSYNVDSLASAIISTVKKEDLWREMGISNRKKIEMNNNLDLNMKKMLDEYYKLLS